MTPPILKRARAAQACVDRFSGKALDMAKDHCAALALHDLHVLGIPVPFLKGVRWRRAANPVRLLRRVGFESLIEAVDALGFRRIGYASCRPADLVALPTESPLGSLAVHVGQNSVFGWHDGDDAPVIIDLGLAAEIWGEHPIIAWRVPVE